MTFIADHPSIDQLLRSFFIICFIWGLYNLSDTTHGIAMKVLLKAGVEFDLALSNVVSTTLRILLIILGFVMIAKEWNYDITGFIASLSIGSLAVALAAKDSLANVFGSLVIIIDKPFVIGDWISANGIEGTVEKSPSAALVCVLFHRNLSISPTPCSPTRPSPISVNVKKDGLILYWD